MTTLNYSVSEVARIAGVRPRDISDLFYSRELPDQRCPIVAGRRLIPVDYVPVIMAALKEHGCIKQDEVTEERAAK
jgi:hypothetical protein